MHIVFPSNRHIVIYNIDLRCYIVGWNIITMSNCYQPFHSNSTSTLLRTRFLNLNPPTQYCVVRMNRVWFQVESDLFPTPPFVHTQLNNNVMIMCIHGNTPDVFSAPFFSVYNVTHSIPINSEIPSITWARFTSPAFKIAMFQRGGDLGYFLSYFPPPP